MARSFNGSSDGAVAAVDLSSYNKISLKFSLYWDAFANDDKFAFEYTNNFNAKNGLIIDPNESGATKFNLTMSAFIGTYNGGSFTRPSGGTWHHYLCTFDRTTGTSLGVTAFVDGVSQSITASNLTDLGSNNFDSSSLYFMSRGVASLFGAGRLAEVGVYGGVILGQGEANGYLYAPPLVRPDKLIAYWPFIGKTSPEIELRHAKGATLTGTAAAAHPAIIYPRPNRAVFVPGGIAPSGKLFRPSPLSGIGAGGPFFSDALQASSA